LAQGSAGSGAQRQRSFPVLASKARTAPSGLSTRSLSAIDEPTMTRSPATAGADVSSNSPRRRMLAMPCLRSISPAAPKPLQGCPVAASSAMSRASIVAMKMRRWHGSPALPPESRHSATPRFSSPSEYGAWRSTLGSKDHFAAPVSGSSATTRLNGVLRYIVPSATMGVASNSRLAPRPSAPVTSPVWYSQAILSDPTFVLSIWVSGE